MQLYVKIRAAQGHCTRQVKAEPRGIVAKSDLSPFMGRGGGGGWRRTQRGPLRTALCGTSRGQGAGALPLFLGVFLTMSFMLSSGSTNVLKENYSCFVVLAPNFYYRILVLN